MNYKSQFLNEINNRGFIYQSSETAELDTLMSKNSTVGYIGFDTTSDSLHIGSLVQLMLLHWLEVYGHKPIALMGGGTTLVGDPSGKVDSVKSRLDREQPLTFLEFNYMLLQAYDFVYLNKEYNCQLQLGGSDQWGNILSGIDLIRKINNNKAFAITSPLITNNDGSKMGKTVDGAIWLSENKLDNNSFYQYWRNIDDKDVEKFLKLFTKLPLKEIEKLSKLKDKEVNEAKKILAFEVTKLCRGNNSALEALEISNNLFNKKISDNRISTIDVDNNKIINEKFNIIDALEKLKLTKSRSEGKRIVKSKGVKVNDETYDDQTFSLKKKLCS